VPVPRDVDLRPFVPKQLAAVRAWFEHPEVRHRLGGPEWPERALSLQQRAHDDEEFRGQRVLRSHTWLAWDGDTPVGFLGGDVYDRWTTWDGSDPDHAVVHHVEEGPAMGSAYVVDPARWRQGYGTAILRAWMTPRETADVRLFALGVDGDNVASARCAEAAGFAASSEEPDWEDTVYFLLRR